MSLVALQGDCNFNLVQGLAHPKNLLAAWGPFGAGMIIRNLGICQSSDSLQGALGAGIGIGNLGISSLQGALGAGIGIAGISGNFEFARSSSRLGLQFPVSEFEPQSPDSTTFVGIWEFQRHGISRGLVMMGAP